MTASRLTRAPARRLLRLLLPLAIAASAVPFLSLLPRTDVQGGTLPALAGTAGLLGALAIWWQFLLGIRPVSAFLLRDRAFALRVHAWLGSLGAAAILMHPLLEAAADRRGLEYLVAINLTFAEGRDITLGRLALLVFLLVWLSSTLIRVAFRRRWWRFVHFLSYPLAVLVFLHAQSIGTFLLTVPWVGVVWSLLAVGFALMVAYRLLAPFLAPRFEVVAVEDLVPGIVRLRFRPRGRILRPEPGQFVMVRARRWSFAHPFSVTALRDEGDFELVLRVVGRFTRRIRTLREGDVVSVDGPYGSHGQGLDPRQPVIMLAGGIGVTPYVRLAAAHPGSTLVHVSRGAHPLEDELRAALERRYRLVSRDGHTPFRVSDAVTDAHPQTRFLVCGSPRFTETVQRELRAAGVSRARIHAEEFDG